MQDGTYKLETVTRDNGYQLGTTPYGASTELSADRALAIVQALLNGGEVGVWTDEHGNKHIETSEHVSSPQRAREQAVDTDQQAVWDWSTGQCVTIVDDAGRTAEQRLNRYNALVTGPASYDSTGRRIGLVDHPGN